MCADARDAELPLPQGLPEALAVFPATVRAQQLAASHVRRPRHRPRRAGRAHEDHPNGVKGAGMNSRSSRSTFAALAVAALFALGLAACGGDDDSSTSGGGGGGGDSGGGGKTIALLLPETKTTRYEEKDRPLFEAKVKELCPDCKVIYPTPARIRTSSSSRPRPRSRRAPSVLVLDAVDVGVGRPDRQAREAEEHPRDRVRPADLRRSDLDYYVSFDNVKSGPRSRRSRCSTGSAPAARESRS